MKRAFWLLLSGLLFLLGLAFTEHFYSCFSLSNSLSDQLSLIHLHFVHPHLFLDTGKARTHPK